MVEADFGEYYGTDPLDLGWRKLMVLLSQLPATARAVRLFAFLSEEPDVDHPILGWKREYDRIRGVRVASSMSVSEYLGGR